MTSEKVCIHFDDDQQQIEVDPGQSLTDICDQHPTAILFGCRNAVCGTCLIEVLQGAENLSPVQAEEQDLLSILAPENSAARLACQCLVLQGSIRVQVLKS